jgi:hypothetical protein
MKKLGLMLGMGLVLAACQTPISTEAKIASTCRSLESAIWSATSNYESLDQTQRKVVQGVIDVTEPTCSKLGQEDARIKNPGEVLDQLNRQLRLMQQAGMEARDGAR